MAIIQATRRSGRELKLIRHRVQQFSLTPSKGYVHVEGTVDVVSPSPGKASFGDVVSLDPLSLGINRVFELYISGSNRINVSVLQVAISQAGIDDIFEYGFGGDLDVGSTEKGDYYLGLFLTHETASIVFSQIEGDSSPGNAYNYKAIYGPGRIFMRNSLL